MPPRLVGNDCGITWPSLSQRQLDREDSSLADFAADCNFSLVLLHNFVGDGQSQTAASAAYWLPGMR
jgi:hypothetical protein